MHSQPEILALACAWCQTILRDGGLPATHGICPTCQRQVFEDTEAARAARITAVVSGGAWGKAAGKIAKQVEDWVKVKRAALN